MTGDLLVSEYSPIKQLVCPVCMYDDNLTNVVVNYRRFDNDRVDVISSKSKFCESCIRLLPLLGKTFRKRSCNFAQETYWELPIKKGRTVLLVENAGAFPYHTDPEQLADISEDKQFIYEIRIDVPVTEELTLDFAVAQSVYKSYAGLIADCTEWDVKGNYYKCIWKFPTLTERYRMYDKKQTIELKSSMGAKVVVYVSNGERDPKYDIIEQMPDYEPEFDRFWIGDEDFYAPKKVLNEPFKKRNGDPLDHSIEIKCEGSSYCEKCFDHYTQT